jgi:hypothetical protein
MQPITDSPAAEFGVWAGASDWVSWLPQRDVAAVAFKKTWPSFNIYN